MARFSATHQPDRAADALPPGDSYRDLHNACHRWLLQHDPAYARDHANGWRRPRQPVPPAGLTESSSHQVTPS
jgi:hypothetical protein